MSKKVKGHNDDCECQECKLLEKIFTIKKCQHKGIHNTTCIYKESITDDNRTTVAKAIDPEYQKVIDQNAKLVEALERISESINSKSFGVNTIGWYREQINIRIVEALKNTKNIEG